MRLFPIDLIHTRRLFYVVAFTIDWEYAEEKEEITTVKIECGD